MSELQTIKETMYAGLENIQKSGAAFLPEPANLAIFKTGVAQLGDVADNLELTGVHSPVDNTYEALMQLSKERYPGILYGDFCLKAIALTRTFNRTRNEQVTPQQLELFDTWTRATSRPKLAMYPSPFIAAITASATLGELRPDDKVNELFSILQEPTYARYEALKDSIDTNYRLNTLSAKMHLSLGLPSYLAKSAYRAARARDQFPQNDR